MNEPINLYTGKYVVSPLDGLTYCRKNGQFMRHIRSFGYQGYQDFFEAMHPDKITYCKCGKKNTFFTPTMSFKQRCGSDICTGLAISDTVSKFTVERWAIRNDRLRATQALKPETIKQKERDQRCLTGYTIGEDGLTAYQRSVSKREKTCKSKYDDPTYNNPEKISATKLNWTNERKQLFLQRLTLALGGKWLTDFATEETWLRRRKKWEAEGRAIPLEQLSEWTKYQKQARILTEKNYRHNKGVINPTNLPRRLAGVDGGYHLDHIIPICVGFIKNIPLEDISCIENLQMLPWRENVTKERIHGVEHKKLESTDT